MDEEKMRVRVHALLATVVVVLLLLVGCEEARTPAFITSADRLTQIEVTNDQTGERGLASKERDNLYELLGLLHLGDLTADSRHDVPEPTASAYTLVAHDPTQVVWSLRVLDAPQSGRVYLRDHVHPANNGIYPLQQSISIEDLNQFVRKYPAP